MLPNKSTPFPSYLIIFSLHDYFMPFFLLHFQYNIYNLLSANDVTYYFFQKIETVGKIIHKLTQNLSSYPPVNPYFTLTTMNGLALFLYNIIPLPLSWILFHIPSTKILHHQLSPISLYYQFSPSLLDHPPKAYKQSLIAPVLKRRKNISFTTTIAPFITPIFVRKSSQCYLCARYPA